MVGTVGTHLVAPPETDFPRDLWLCRWEVSKSPASWIFPRKTPKSSPKSFWNTTVSKTHNGSHKTTIYLYLCLYMNSCLFLWRIRIYQRCILWETAFRCQPFYNGRKKGPFKKPRVFSVWGVQLTCEKGWLIPAWYFGIDIQQILGIEFVKQLKPTASWIFQLMCWMHDKFSSSMCQDHLCRYGHP